MTVVSDHGIAYACPRCYYASGGRGSCPECNTRMVPITEPSISDPFVACALCPVTVPGHVMPKDWMWLPEGRVCCGKCARTNRPKELWFEYKTRHKRRKAR